MNQQLPLLDDSAPSTGFARIATLIYFSPLMRAGDLLPSMPRERHCFLNRRGELIGQCAWDVFPADFVVPVQEQCRQVSHTVFRRVSVLIMSLSNRCWEVRAYPEREPLAFFLHDLLAPLQQAATDEEPEGLAARPSLRSSIRHPPRPGWSHYRSQSPLCHAV